MDAIYPIKLILLYFAMLFAPPDADRFVLDGPGMKPMEIFRDGERWKEGDHEAWLEGDRIFTDKFPGDHDAKIDQFIASPVGHDWEKEPRLDLGNSTVIERSPDGFVCETQADGAEKGTYRVRYGAAKEAEPEPAGPITVNVLGEVNRPGAYQVRANGSLVDAVAAAGGWTKTANTRMASVVRGKAGEIPEVTEHNLDAILKGGEASPELREGDTVYVPEAIF